MNIQILWDLDKYFQKAPKIFGLSIPVQINGDEQNVYVNSSFIQRLDGYQPLLDTDSKVALLQKHKERLSSAIAAALAKKSVVDGILHVTDKEF